MPLLGGLFPGSSVGGGGSTATGLGSGGSTSVDDREERYAVTDILYKNTGAMSWKFGVDVSHSLQNVIPLFAALGGSYAFAATQTNSTGAGTALTTGGSPWASYMLGVANGKRDAAQYRDSVLLPLGSDRRVRAERLEDQAQPDAEPRRALQPADAAHGEVRQPGRLPARIWRRRCRCRLR